MTETAKTLSPAMASALGAVSRVGSDAKPDAALWAEFWAPFATLG